MSSRLGGLIELMRPQQWIKNGFVLAPLLFSGHLTNPAIALSAAGATLIFCLLSSVVYVFNDIHDVESDRSHTKKRRRPLPSGRVALAQAWMLLALLLVAAALLTLAIGYSRLLVVILGAYLVVNLIYSMGAKHLPIVELFLVSIGYVLRLMAGGEVVGDPPLTPWILACTALLSLMLTVGKRRGDIAQENDSGHSRRSLASYNLPFLDVLLAVLGSATLVTYLLFCMSDYAMSRFGAHVLWTSLFVGLGLFRFLQIAIVEDGGDAPVEVILKDPMIRYAVLLFIVAFAVLIYLP